MRNIFILSTILILAALGCCKDKGIDSDYEAIMEIRKKYLEGWRLMDEMQVMSLLEENARIQPNRLAPIQGKDAIRDFWFPDDGSITKIHEYETEILNIDVRDTLAFSTQTSYLNWSYHKDTISIGRIQRGLGTTIYRKQKNGEWKIWRQMWTDYYYKKL